jgi:hypothetical protein
VDDVQEAAERGRCNLGSVAYALHNYHGANGRLPPAVLRGKDGTPLQSWRVLILQFIEQQSLFAEFRLDEPWDGPHNITLLPRMPQLYAPPGRKAAKVPPHHTLLHVFVGPGTPFEERSPRPPLFGTIDPLQETAGRAFLDDFPGERADTILFVEAGAPSPWTKPEDLPYHPDRPLPELRCVFRDGFRACSVHGSYRFIRRETDETTLRTLIALDGRGKVNASVK